MTLRVNFSIPRAPLGAFCLILCLAGDMAITLFDIEGGAYVAVPALLIYLGINLRQTSTVVKVFFCFAMLLIITAGLTPLTSADIYDGLQRMVFLGGLLTALSFIRMVAAHDGHFARAGRYLTAQPPTRRYVSLSLGGHVFATLLNMGGVGLLVETVNRALLARRDSMSPLVFQLRQRRIVSAIMRGFATIAMVTPFGIALNSALLVFPELHWIDVAPFGLLFMCALLILGWSLDSLERRLRPLNPKPPAESQVKGDSWSVAVVVMHVLGLGSAIFLLDIMLPVSFQSVLLFVVPGYSLCWISYLYRRTGPVVLSSDFIRRASTLSTEVGVFSMAGLLGPMIGGLLPEAALNPVFNLVASQPVVIALALFWMTALFSVAGIHPIISVIVLGELVLRNGGISDLAATLALLSGWVCSVTIAPFTTTAVFISQLVDHSVWRVTWGWNYVYSLGAITLFSLLLVGGMFLGFF